MKPRRRRKRNKIKFVTEIEAVTKALSRRKNDAVFGVCEENLHEKLIFT